MFNLDRQLASFSCLPPPDRETERLASTGHEELMRLADSPVRDMLGPMAEDLRGIAMGTDKKGIR